MRPTNGADDLFSLEGIMSILQGGQERNQHTRSKKVPGRRHKISTLIKYRSTPTALEAEDTERYVSVSRPHGTLLNDRGRHTVT